QALGERPVGDPPGETPLSVSDIEVDALVDRGSNALADAPPVVEHTLGAAMIEVRDDVAAHQPIQNIFDRDGAVAGVHDDRLADGVGDRPRATQHLASMLWIWSNEGSAQPNLDARDGVGVRPRDFNRTVHISPPDLF